jgi:DNA (cytosine-5)-methyltransferase 1
MPKNIDILTYSFPCQDLSMSGKQKGLEKGTRSGLLWEVGRILEEMEEMEEKPKFLLLENVATLLSPKFAPLFEIWQKKLEEMGYFNQIFILNSLNFGIPQNRKRLFMISSPYVKDVETFSRREIFKKSKFLLNKV